MGSHIVRKRDSCRNRLRTSPTDYSARGTIFTPADAVRAGAAQLKTFLDTLSGALSPGPAGGQGLQRFHLDCLTPRGQKSTLPALYNCVYHLVPSKAA